MKAPSPSIPEARSVAVTVTGTAPSVHPLVTPLRWVAGSFVDAEDRSPTTADRIPEPDTATTWTWSLSWRVRAIGIESSSTPPRRSVSAAVQRVGPAHGWPSGQRSIETA